MRADRDVFNDLALRAMRAPVADRAADKPISEVAAAFLFGLCVGALAAFLFFVVLVALQGGRWP